MAECAAVSEYLESVNSNGEFWVGITFHSGVPGGTASTTILKYGTSEENATTPVGSDSAEPEENILVFGDPIDPNTVEVNQPALLWDATMSSFTADPTGTDIQLTAQGDNSYHVKASNVAPYFIWGIKNSLTYNAEDFPVFVMMLRDYWGSEGGVYYCAGEVMTANETVNIKWTPWDDDCKSYGEDDEYTLIVVDLSDLWSGRIHSVRPYFNVTDTTDPDYSEWDICYMGMFRSVDEAQAYSDSWIENLLGEGALTEPETTEAPETESAAPETNASEDDTTVASEDTSVAETTANETEDEDGSSCGSVIGAGAAVAVLVAAAAAVALKKKD